MECTMVSVPLLEKGAVYDSYDEFCQALEKYSIDNNAQFCTIYSKSVQSANRLILSNASKRKAVVYHEKLKYRTVKFGCKHYGTRRSSGTGRRPNQQTYKNECPVYVTVAARIRSQTLLVTELLLDHNHELSADAFRHYPERRRLDPTELKNFHQLESCSIPPTLIRQLMLETTGKLVTPKDICNIRAQEKTSSSAGRTDAEVIVEELQELVTEDPQTIAQVAHSCDGAVTSLFMQTGDMLETFRNFPEILLLDTTYCVKTYNKPLLVLMSLDGFGNGRVVAYCFVTDDEPDTIRDALIMFLESNQNAFQETRTVVVDKDYDKVAFIDELLPNATIHICRHHVIRAFRAALKNEGVESIDEIRLTLRQLVDSGLEDDYDRRYARLVDLASTSFIEYYNANWHHCSEAWTNQDQESSLSLGNETTRIGAQNDDIKTILTRHESLSKAIKGLLLVNKTKDALVSHQRFTLTYKSRYVQKKKAEDEDAALYKAEEISELYASCTPYICKVIVKQLETSYHLQDVEMTSTGLTVGSRRKEYEVSVQHCNCLVASTFAIPCCHIFYVRRESNLPLFDISLVAERWTLKHNAFVNGRDGVKLPERNAALALILASQPAVKTKADRERHGKIQAVANEMCSMLLKDSAEKYKRRLGQLEAISKMWAQDKDFELVEDTPLEKVQIEDPVDNDDDTEDDKEDQSCAAIISYLKLCSAATKNPEPEPPEIKPAEIVELAENLPRAAPAKIDLMKLRQKPGTTKFSPMTTRRSVKILTKSGKKK